MKNYIVYRFDYIRQASDPVGHELPPTVHISGFPRTTPVIYDAPWGTPFLEITLESLRSMVDPMKSPAVIVLVLAATVSFLPPGVGSAQDWNSSPHNWQNSPHNWQNNPNNWQNSPYNWRNSPYNRGNDGNRFRGYAVRQEDGGVIIFDWNGNRIGYKPPDR